MALKRDPKTGKFVSDKGNVAVYTSTGPGTFNIRELILTMEPAMTKKANGRTTSGKRIDFKDGKYETSDPKEIEFLNWKCENPKPFSAIRCIQEMKEEKEKEVS